MMQSLRGSDVNNVLVISADSCLDNLRNVPLILFPWKCRFLTVAPYCHAGPSAGLVNLHVCIQVT
jgi:hypothetical protein